MLGTNDCKTYYHANPHVIGKGLERCIEEIEYASYGQRSRVTSTYDDATGKVIEEVEYNDRNRRFGGLKNE